jgi:hypothetical protein
VSWNSGYHQKSALFLGKKNKPVRITRALEKKGSPNERREEKWSFKKRLDILFAI